MTIRIEADMIPKKKLQRLIKAYLSGTAKEKIRIVNYIGQYGSPESTVSFVIGQLVYDNA